MPRFIYNAHALAVAGYLRKPVSMDLPDHCTCVLPSIGGRAAARSGPYRLSDPQTGRLLVSYEAAECSLAGYENEQGERRTELRVALKGLNVLDVLRVEEILGVLTVVHPRNGPARADAAGSRFAGLVLGGRTLDIELDHGLIRAAPDYAGLRAVRPGLRETRGVIRYSLARHELLKFDDWEHGYLDHAGFGRLYFCEWWAAPYRQGLSMLRLRLGSPAQGEMEAGTIEADGHDYP